MKNKNTKVLISGYYGFSNFGDETILSILSGKLKSYDHDVTVLSSSPQKTSELYGIKAVYSFDVKAVISAILQSDVLISGGGSLLQDVTSVKSLIYYLFVINCALLAGKKVVIFAQGIGPINNKIAALLTKLTLKRCKYVSVRDKKSRMIMKKWGINADLVCDPIFDIELPEYSPQNIVGVQLRKFKTLNINYIKQLAKYIGEKFSDKKIEIFSFQDALDLEICKTFEKYLKEITPDINTEIISNAASDDIIKRFSHLNYLIAMRFHAVLVALKYGIKTLALSYDIKVEKLAEEAHIPYLCLKSNDDLQQGFADMFSINSKDIKNYANSEKFNWEKLESHIN